MFGYFEARRAQQKARRAYELARLESLIAENRRALERLQDLGECKWCNDKESTKQREICESQFGA